MVALLHVVRYMPSLLGAHLLVESALCVPLSTPGPPFEIAAAHGGGGLPSDVGGQGDTEGSTKGWAARYLPASLTRRRHRSAGTSSSSSLPHPPPERIGVRVQLLSAEGQEPVLLECTAEATLEQVQEASARAAGLPGALFTLCCMEGAPAWRPDCAATGSDGSTSRVGGCA